MTTVEQPRNLGLFGLVRRLVGGFVTLARLEATHGRQEIGQMLGNAKTGALFIAVALACVFMLLIAFVVFIVLGLSALLGWPAWVVALLTLFIFLALVVLFGVLAFLKLRTLGPPQETIESVKEDVAWAKRLLRRE